MKIDTFSPLIEKSVLVDLKQRIRGTRWPTIAPDPLWQQGTDLNYMQSLLKYWAEEFATSHIERTLGPYSHFIAQTEGLNIHFIHVQAHETPGIPLLLTHGWPSNFVEYLPIISFLTNPKRHGLSGQAFDVIIPSLPGYGFSTRLPIHTTRDTARIWHNLMNALGYSRYALHGTDFGAGVSTFLALDFPDDVIGLHLSNVENSPSIGPDSAPLTEAEREFVERGDKWFDEEGGYKSIQRTRPLSLAYGLTDSPAGLAAWVLEKWRAWSDSEGLLESTFDRDFLLTMLTVFWMTNSIGTSIRDYFDNRASGYTLKVNEFVACPTAIAGFSNCFIGDDLPPKEWVRRMYNVQRWTPMAKGGHFAAAEQPKLLSQDIMEFFSTGI